MRWRGWEGKRQTGAKFPSQPVLQRPNGNLVVQEGSSGTAARPDPEPRERWFSPPPPRSLAAAQARTPGSRVPLVPGSPARSSGLLAPLRTTLSPLELILAVGRDCTVPASSRRGPAVSRLETTTAAKEAVSPWEEQQLQARPAAAAPRAAGGATLGVVRPLPERAPPSLPRPRRSRPLGRSVAVTCTPQCRGLGGAPAGGRRPTRDLSEQEASRSPAAVGAPSWCPSASSSSSLALIASHRALQLHPHRQPCRRAPALAPAPVSVPEPPLRCVGAGVSRSPAGPCSRASCSSAGADASVHCPRTRVEEAGDGWALGSGGAEVVLVSTERRFPFMGSHHQGPFVFLAWLPGRSRELRCLTRTRTLREFYFLFCKRLKFSAGRAHFVLRCEDQMIPLIV